MARNNSNWSRILIVIAFLGFYIFGLYRNANEASRRSLQLKYQAPEADQVLIRATITSVNPVAGQLTAELSFLLFGNIAQDQVTPKANMKLLVNNIAGDQEYDFPRGKRMSRIEVTFPVDGDVNKYPLDRHRSELRFLLTTPAKIRIKPETPRLHQDLSEANPRAHELVVGEAAFQGYAPVPLSISLLASVPGVKFSGEVSQSKDSKLTTVGLNLRRPDNLIIVSFLVMFMMMGLATSVLAMAMKATAAVANFDLLPLSFALTLIFGLPALRSIQPGVPPVGELADYFSFVWAELFVASAAVIIMWTWLTRSRTESK